MSTRADIESGPAAAVGLGGSSYPPRTRAVHNVILAVFLGTAAALVAQSIPLRSANDRSRWSTVWSLVERGTYQIDEIDAKPKWQTIDKVRHRKSETGDWHYYSTKPPLTPTLTAGVYYVVRRATGLSLYRHTNSATRLILFIVQVIPMFVALVLFSRLLLRHTESPGAGVAVLATMCFGTLLTPFLTVFNNHIVAATAVLLTVCFAARILIEGSRSNWHFAACGFFAMWTCCNELPAALFGLAIFWLLLRTDVRRTLMWFAPAALVPLAGFLVTNYLATGGWKPLYMYYGTDRYVFTVDGVPSYWTNPKGLDANTEPPLTYLFHCVLGHHGILSLTPVFFLSLWGVLQPRSYRHPVRPFLLPAAALTVAVLGFYVSRTENYNYGGNTSGLRWAFWLIPLWIVAMVPVCERLWRSRRFRAVFLVLLVGSVASAGYAAKNPWGKPWLFELMEGRGWFDYSTPGPKLEGTLQSWFSEVPEIGDGAFVEAVYQSDRVPAAELRVRVENAGGDMFVTLDCPERGLRSYRTKLDVAAVQEGRAASDFLSATGDAERDAAAVRLLSGIPVARPLLARRTVYLKTPLRRDAFECIQCSVSVIQRKPEARWHRCDVWITEDSGVPFGAIRIRETVTDAGTAEVLLRQTWTIRSVSAGPDQGGVD